jgi:hypothetical protein
MLDLRWGTRRRPSLSTKHSWEKIMRRPRYLLFLTIFKPFYFCSVAALESKLVGS